MDARDLELPAQPAAVIDLTLEDTDSDSRGPASSSASSGTDSGTDSASSPIGRSTSNEHFRYMISPTFERSKHRRLMTPANKDVNQTMARLQDRAKSVKINDTGLISGFRSSGKRSADEMEDGGMPEDHPFKSRKASRKSAVCVRSVPSPTTSSGCEITDVRTTSGSIPSRVGIPWGLESSRKPRAVHKALLPSTTQDDMFSATYLASFHHPRFEPAKSLMPHRCPFLNRNVLRCLITMHGDQKAKDYVKSQATPDEVILDHLLPKRLHEESQISTARLGRILQVDLTSIQGEKAPPIECGDYARISLLLSDGSSRSHRLAWKVNRRVSVTKTGLVSFEPPITEVCPVPADWATCVCELRILLVDEDAESKPCSPQFALCRGGIYEDLHDGPGVMIGQNIVARTLPGSFEWSYSSKLRQIPRKLLKVTKSQPSLHFIWNDEQSLPPSPRKVPQVTGWWCPFCTIGDCLEYRIWSKHLAGSHSDQVGEHDVLRDESRAGHLVIRLERPGTGAVQTVAQHTQYPGLGLVSTVQTTGTEDNNSQRSSLHTLSDLSTNSTTDLWGSEMTSIDSSEYEESLLRGERRAGHLVIRFKRPGAGAVQTTAQHMQDLGPGLVPAVQTIGSEGNHSQESRQHTSSLSDLSGNSTRDSWGSEMTSKDGSDYGDALSSKAFNGLNPDLAMVKQELPDGQTWRVRNPQRYVPHSSWTVPGTTMDLMLELRKYFQRDENESYAGLETAKLIWTQHHLTDRMRLMSCVWNQWREEQGPMGKLNTDGYMLAFVQRYASFFRIARLRSEFERLVMDFLWERRLVTLDLALGVVALYHELVQDR